MLSRNRIRCRKLKRLWDKGDDSKIRPEWRGKVRRILAALPAMTHPSELNVPGYNWHEMKGDRQGTYSVLISKNWRITYRWDEQGPYDVQMEDYHHGR